jgi:hypothetical protein
VEKFYTPMEGDSIKTDLDSLLLQENAEKVKKKFTFRDTLLMQMPKMRLSIEGGYSYRTAKIPSGMVSEVEDYLKELKTGFNLSIDLAYFFHREYAIALKYSRFSSSNSMDNIYYEDTNTGQTGYGTIEDKISIAYIGLGVTQRLIAGSGSGLLIGHLSVGQLNYNNDSKVIYIPIDIEGSSFGLHGLIGLEYFVSEKVGLGGSFSYLYGNMKEIKANGEQFTSSEGESLNRLDFNLGIKLYF